MAQVKNTIMRGLGNTNQAPRKAERARNWSFTLNNYSQKDIDNICEQKGGVRYWFQEETGANGTKHLQGTISFPNAISFESAKLAIGGTAHIEKTRNLRQSVLYCCKEETRTGRIFSNSTIPGTKHKKILEESELNKICWREFWASEIGKGCLLKLESKDGGI